jgi:hypothetical protein
MEDTVLPNPGGHTAVPAAAAGSPRTSRLHVVPSSVLAQLLDALAGHVEETADEMALLIQDEFELYRTFESPEAERAWRNGLCATLALFVRLQQEERGLDREETAFIEHIGETRADQRFPLDVVLGSVRLAMHVALGAVHRIAERSKDGDNDAAVSDTFHVVSLRMTQFINAFSTALSNGYFRRVEERVRALERDRAMFVDDWLAGAYVDDDDIRRAILPLGLDLSDGLGVVLVPTAGITSHLMVAHASNALGPVVAAPVASAAVPHVVLVVRARTRAEWRTVQEQLGAVITGYHMRVLVQGPGLAVRDVPARYVEAAAMLHLLDNADVRGRVVHACGLAPAHLVASGAGTARAVIEREILDPLRARPNAEKLLFYLQALVLHGSAKAVAGACRVDVRTVRTHKRDIEQVTGRSFEHAGDAVWLGLAAMIAAL